jgi:hypothetical protein
MSDNVISLADRRAKAEGWENVPVDVSVFDCGNGLAEVRIVTGSALEDSLDVTSVQMQEATLSVFIERATRVRDEMRNRKAARVF